MVAALIWDVVSVYTCDNDIFQAPCCNCFSHFGWFLRIRWRRCPRCLYSTKPVPSLSFLSLLFFLIISFYTHTSFLLLELEILGWLDSASKIHFIPMAPLCSLEIKGGMKFLRFFLPSLLFAFCVSLLSV